VPDCKTPIRWEVWQVDAADATPGPLLAVKQSVPPVPPYAVPRRRLTERLESTPTKLTVVVAPAGWGKTSLLSQWAAETLARVAWVSLDEGDDEPVRFWSYVLSSLRRVSDDITDAATAALSASSGGPTARALPVLLNEVAEAKHEHVLVLDDFHLITRRDLHESVEYLASYLPPGLRIVIASRTHPPLPLARMRVRGELTEIRADDLRFTLDESAALVTGVAESAPEPDVIAASWERTEGWAAGLQLTGLALRGGAISRPDERHLFDYFTAEVLPSLAPEQRDLLVRAAPLDFLSGPLCDAALDVTGSAAVLADLERADLFVVALDGEREWYRCHRLLRDVLHRTADAQSEATTREVRRRAARWYLDHRRIDDAVRHLLAAGDVEEAAAVLEAEQTWFLERGGPGVHLALGAQLPESVITAQLALNLAHSADVSGHPEQIEHWLTVCERRIGPDTVVENWRSPEAARLSLWGVWVVPADRTAEAVEICERAMASERAAGTERHPFGWVALGRAYGFDGRFAEAIEILTECWEQRDAREWPAAVSLRVAGGLGLFMTVSGADESLDRLLAEAAPLADAAERDWGHAVAAPMTAMLRAVQGRRSYHRGDLESARTELEHALVLAEIAARPMFLLPALVFLAGVELGTGDRAAARDLLARAREVVDNEPVAPFLRATLEAAETRIGRQATRRATETGALFEELTDRELSILRMLPGEASQREIGAALFLSINTVKAYNKSLYRKLGVASRADAVEVARGLGLI
jgi:LuxR family maltose regulon positive regulatory protein